MSSLGLFQFTRELLCQSFTYTEMCLTGEPYLRECVLMAAYKCLVAVYKYLVAVYVTSDNQYPSLCKMLLLCMLHTHAPSYVYRKKVCLCNTVTYALKLKACSGVNSRSSTTCITHYVVRTSLPLPSFVYEEWLAHYRNKTTQHGSRLCVCV